MSTFGGFRGHLYFIIYFISTSDLVPDGWIESEIFGCMCHFRTFQFELDNLGTKKFEIGPVDKKLQPYPEVVYKIFYKI